MRNVRARRLFDEDHDCASNKTQLQGKDHHSPYESPPFSSLTSSLKSIGFATSSTAYPTRQQELQRRIADGIEAKIQLECVIVPSFGTDPPSNVVVKKSAGDFLKGVGDDFKIIQRLVRDDSRKELISVQLMCHFERVNVSTFLERIEDLMKRLKLNSTSNHKKGRK